MKTAASNDPQRRFRLRIGSPEQRADQKAKGRRAVCIAATFAVSHFLGQSAAKNFGIGSEIQNCRAKDAHRVEQRPFVFA